MNININREMIMIIFYGAVYIVYGITALFVALEIMLNVKKKKTFFTIFFTDMLLFNMATFILKQNPQYSYRAVLIIILQIMSFCIYIAVLKWITGNDWMNIVLADAVGEILGAIGTLFPWVAIPALFGKRKNAVLAQNIDTVSVIVFISTIIIMTGFIILERIFLKRYLCGFYKIKIKKGRFFIWIMIGVFWMVGLVPISTLSRDNLPMVISCIAVLILFVVSYGIFHVNKRRKERAIKKENQILNIENAVIKEYYNTLNYQMELTRKFRHDIEKHMLVLQEMISDYKNKELREYAEQIQEQKNYLQTIDYCGNLVVNAILVNKKRQCNEEHIQFKIEMSRFDLGNIKEIDFVAIISNLLDNAIEECLKIKSERIIELKCCRSSTHFLLCVKNTLNNKDYIFDKKNLHTWKEDDYAHGIGCSIVCEIVQKYDGTFQLKNIMGMCEATIYIPLKTENKSYCK